MKNIYLNGLIDKKINKTEKQVTPLGLRIICPSGATNSIAPPEHYVLESTRGAKLFVEK